MPGRDNSGKTSKEGSELSDDTVWRLIGRRQFLKTCSLAAAAGLTFPRNLLGSMAPMSGSRVIIVEDSGATAGTSIDAGVVQSMMNCGIINTAGVSDVGEAWKALLPGVGPASIVAVKVNCLNYSLPTHPEVAYAAAEGMKQMDFGGSPFPENNIIIFDRSGEELSWSRYSLNTSATGVRCFGTDASGVGYSTETYDVNGVSEKLSRIVTDMADYVVNISVLKNHSGAGVTLSLKNHYGTCNSANPLHGNACDPYIPALNALAPIRGKQTLSICDALFGIYSGGPGGSPQVTPNRLIFSTDPVAMDYVGRDLLAGYGCTTINKAHHIDTAAGAPYNLGTNDPGQITIETFSEPAGIEPEQPYGGERGLVLERNTPNPFRDETDIRFHVPQRQKLTLAVYDARGRRIRGLMDRELGPGWHQARWNGRDDSGRKVAGGIYFCEIRSNGSRKSLPLNLVR
jgi:uncharacterized protein (DUF362 family)